MSRNSVSSAEGGTNRSPFLTAPFTKIVQAFGEDKILQPKKKKKGHKLKEPEARKIMVSFSIFIPLHKLQNYIPRLWIAIFATNYWQKIVCPWVQPHSQLPLRGL